MRHEIEAALIEFDEGGNTIWVQSPFGATVLRIKATGKIKVSRGCENSVSHSDMMIQGDIEICLVQQDDSAAAVVRTIEAGSVTTEFRQQLRDGIVLYLEKSGHGKIE